MSNENKETISLLGCGWLGFPLATDLLSKGFTVKGSTTSEDKLERFAKAGIDPFLVQFHSSGEYPDVQRFLQADILIISVPPGRRNPDGFDNYRRMIGYLAEALPSTNISKIILISSTSVYPDDNSYADEFSETRPDTESGKLMVWAENEMRQLPRNVIILRLAGLIGPDRLPGKFFAGKKDVPNGLSPVNLIHLDDVIGLITRIIQDDSARGIYNGVAPSHPAKQDFYTRAAEAESLHPPHFINEKTNWKIVTSSRLQGELAFEFERPLPDNWLKNN